MWPFLLLCIAKVVNNSLLCNFFVSYCLMICFIVLLLWRKSKEKMKMNRVNANYAWIACLLCLAFGLSASASKPRRIILDTDWWTDVDDAACVRMLTRAHRAGKIRLAGICVDAVRETSLPSLSSFLDYEGCPEIPLGADWEATDYNGTPCYHQMLAEYGEKTVSPRKAEDCVSFYRRLLSKVKGQVDILAVGYPNALARLLQSPADDFSPLDGRELVRRKVRHLCMMAGNYPQGKENNFTRTERSRKAGALLCREWPTEITFLGYDIGVDVLFGATLDADDLLHQVVCRLMPQGRRSSWDPLTAWMAILGDASAVGFGWVRGTNTVDDATGANVFVEAPAGKHTYLVRLHDVSWYEARLDSLLSSTDWRRLK